MGLTAKLILLVAFFAQPIIAANFTQCLLAFQNSTQTGGIDSNGNPTAANSSSLVGLTYEACKQNCGSSASTFNWTDFTQSFSAWLLPWLALLSNLPYGAKRRHGNFTSVLLAVGSPTLALFSLTLTMLNGSWLARRMSGMNYPNVEHAYYILNSLQQAPWVIGTLPERHDEEPVDGDDNHGDEENGDAMPLRRRGGLLEADRDTLINSLIVLHQNDEWWSELHRRIDYVHPWSLAVIASVAWVVVAYFLTVLGSFESLYTDQGSIDLSISNGQAVGTAWLWLLPVVVGWLWVAPKCDYTRIEEALKGANVYAYVASATEQPVRANDVSGISGILLRQEYQRDGDNDDEYCSAPIFNFTRNFVWTRQAELIAEKFEVAASRAFLHEPLNGSPQWEHSLEGVANGNRVGTRDQVRAYCEDKKNEIAARRGSNILSRLVIASVLSLFVQWSTTGSAIVILWFTPTIGLGCRSSTYLLYASLSTVAWFLLVLSSILIHFSPPRTRGLSRRRRQCSILRTIAVGLGWSGKLVASINAIFIIVTCIMQLASLYDSCFCNTQLLYALKHHWDKTYDVLVITPQEITELQKAWIPGLIMGAGGAAAYITFAWVYANPVM